KASNTRPRHDHPSRCAARSLLRSLFLKSTMGAILVVVIYIRSKQALQMRLVDDNHVVQQFATTVADPTFGDPVLPTTGNSRLHRLDAHQANRSGLSFAKTLCGAFSAHVTLLHPDESSNPDQSLTLACY